MGRSLRELKSVRGSSHSAFKDTWLGRNWSTVLILVAIVLLALFMRSYFGFSTAVGDHDFLVAGGSDSYYHQRVIDYVNEEGSHLVNDPALNYPFGMRNARPPIYDWSVAVSSQVLAGISGMDLSDAAGYSLLFSTAFWGSLTCIPVYMITRSAFGNRAGILAALLLAFMPGHISRSVFANADHDAMVLFFVVFAFYFLMKALQSIKGTKWVSSWKNTDNIRTGLKSYFRQNQRSLIYAVLGGVCIATVAMMWTGYMYILIIVLVYYLVQVLINRFRNLDSMGEFFIVGTMLLTGFALAAPLYYQLNYWNVWFDTPFYLFMGSMAIGGFFTVTRDYPWTLTIPVIGGIIAAGLVAVFFLAPSMFETIISGQGYLVQSKLYSTIDEASAPEFSTLVFNFGVVTFWLAIIGLVWAAVKIPKDQSPYLVFVVVWLGLSMYMASAAGRFLFNASPAFAMAAGWILALLIGMAKFSEVPKLWTGFWANPRSTFRKALKFKYVAVALFLAFLVVLPNVWTAVDAGIPSQTKSDYDKEIYNAMPEWLRPADYDSYSYWYFGAFGYSLPLPSTYWPQAWSWLSTQDANQQLEDRPAFLSWWDYGFEAIQEGQHPTVSDNFQNSYMYSGSFLMSQNESDAVSMFIIRALEKTGFTGETKQILQSEGVNVTELQNIMQNPQDYVEKVKNNPLIYGPYDSDLSAENAKYAAARIELQKADGRLESLVKIYNKLREVSGVDIGYFAVDGRLFPFSATSQTIFYAPAKLSDRVIDPVTNAPTDYYEIMVVTKKYETKRISDLTANDQILTYTIVYKDAFYNSMLYRGFMGIAPADIGSTSQGIPGVSGSLYNYNAMPGYNLTHFKQVYRTAYYNPYTDAANHSDAWKAVSWDEALSLQKKVDAGAEGVVDMSASVLSAGVVFLQYYDGVVLNGTARSSDGSPYAGIYVTVVDEYGIPHQTVTTDANGRYSVILPFGNVSVVYSAGTLNGATQIATEMDRVNYTISYEQAMREPGEDWTLEREDTLPAAIVTGSVFYDINNNGRYDAGEEYIVGAQVTIKNPATGFDETVTTGATGSYRIIALAGSSQTITATYDGHTLGESTVTLTPNSNTNRSIAVRTASVSGTISLPSGSDAAGVNLTLLDKANNKKYYATSGSDGKYTFSKLLPGKYTLSTTDESLSVGTQDLELTSGQAATKNLKLVQAVSVTGTVWIGGTPQPNVPVVFRSEQREISVLTDDSGRYVVALPVGEYSVYAVTVTGGTEYAYISTLDADDDLTGPQDITLVQATEVSGTVKYKGNGTSGATVVFTLSDGAYVKAAANAKGEYNVIIPIGTYFVYAYGAGKSCWDSDVAIAADATLDIVLDESTYLTGTVFRDLNDNGEKDSSEAGISYALLKVWLSGSSGEKVHIATSSAGKYNISVPVGSYVINATVDGYTSWEGEAKKDLNIPLEALNRTVAGNVTSGGGGIAEIIVTFIPQGGGEHITVVTDANGDYTTAPEGLQPGSYWVEVNQNETAGNDSSRYYYNSTLTVPIARDPDALSIKAAVQYKVNGTIMSPNGGEGTIRFIGPENKTVDAAAPFPLYLKEGNYTIYIDLKNGDTHYVYLANATVGATGTELGQLDVVYAGVLRGQVQYEDEDLSAAASIKITAPDGAVLTTTATSKGAFDVYLPNNATYTVDAEYRTTATLDDGASRYVRYHNESMPVAVQGDRQETFSLIRDLDNVTLSIDVSGTAADVDWQFVALSETAVDSTVTTGSGASEVVLAPGTYSVYASAADGANAIYLGIVDVSSGGGTALNITLEAGFLVSGTVTYEGAAQEGAVVTFADNAVAKATTDAAGVYSIYLPNGYYNVTAKLTDDHEAAGVNITYSRSFDLNVIGADVPNTNIVLNRELNGAVQVIWSAPDPLPYLNPGESYSYDVTIKNIGNIDDTYELSTTSDWGVAFSQKTVSLAWGTGATKTVTVTLTAPEGAKASNPNSIKIVAKSVNRTSAEGSATLKINIHPTYHVEVSQGAAASTNGTVVTYSILVKNTGTAGDYFWLNLTNVDSLAGDGWTARIASTSELSKRLYISAGSAQTVTVTLTRADPNAKTDVALEVTAKSETNSATGTALESFALATGDLSVGDDQLTASGRGANMNAPSMTWATWLLIAMIALTFAGVVILRFNKGVFGRRRKR